MAAAARQRTSSGYFDTPRGAEDDHFGMRMSVPVQFQMNKLAASQAIL